MRGARDMSKSCCPNRRSFLYALAGGVLWTHSVHASERADPVRVVTFNARRGTADRRRFEQFIASSRPHLVFLQEVHGGWVDRVQLDGYTVRKGRRALALATRLPILDDNGAAGAPGQSFLRLLVDPGTGVPTAAYAFHPTSPRMKDGTAKRAADYSALAEALDNEPGDRSVILAGDFNAPPGDPLFRDLMNSAELSVADAGTLSTPTRFAMEYGLPSWLGVAIDHVAVRGGYEVLSRRVGPDLGSDHLPVTVDLSAASAG